MAPRIEDTEADPMAKIDKIILPRDYEYSVVYSVSSVALLMRIAESVDRVQADTTATLETRGVPDRQFSVVNLVHWRTLDSHQVIPSTRRWACTS